MRTIKLRDGSKYVFATSAREVKRELINRNMNGNLAKWLGYYDIAVPEQPGKLIPTGLRTLQDVDLNTWIELFKKAKEGFTYLK